MRLLDTHNSEGKDAHVEYADAKQLQIVASSQSIKAKGCNVKVAQGEYAKVDRHNICSRHLPYHIVDPIEVSLKYNSVWVLVARLGYP